MLNQIKITDEAYINNVKYIPMGGEETQVNLIERERCGSIDM